MVSFFCFPFQQRKCSIEASVLNVVDLDALLAAALSAGSRMMNTLSLVTA